MICCGPVMARGSAVSSFQSSPAAWPRLSKHCWLIRPSLPRTGRRKTYESNQLPANTKTRYHLRKLRHLLPGARPRRRGTCSPSESGGTTFPIPTPKYRRECHVEFSTAQSCSVPAAAAPRQKNDEWEIEQ